MITYEKFKEGIKTVDLRPEALKELKEVTIANKDVFKPLYYKYWLMLFDEIENKRGVQNDNI